MIRPLFETSLPTRIALENVYINGFHILRRFFVRNNSTTSSILVQPKSNLGSQITFQLVNENFDQDDAGMQISEPAHHLTFPVDGPHQISSLSSVENLVSEATSSSFASEQPDSLSGASIVPSPHIPLPTSIETIPQESTHNPLYNFVDNITEFVLKPGETKPVILLFLPDIPQQYRSGPPTLDTSTDNEAVGAEAGSGPSDFTDVNGMLFFFAYELPTNARKDSFLDHPSDSSIGMTPKRLFAALEAVGDAHLTDSESGRDSSSVSSYVEPTRSPDYQASVKFRAKCCRSVLSVDVAGKGLQFQDCVAGSVAYFRDFTISNKSEIALFWTINLVDLDNRPDRPQWFKFSDYDNMLDEIRPGEPQKPIPAYSHRRVRVTLKPKSVGEHKLLLEVENVRDSRNIEQLPVRAWVKDRSQADIIVLSAQALDFGDCVAGTWAKQTLALRNTSDLALDVHFEAEQVGSTGRVMVTQQVMSVGVNKLDRPKEIGASSYPSNGMSDDAQKGLAEQSTRDGGNQYIETASEQNSSKGHESSQIDESRSKIEDLHIPAISDRVVEVWYWAEPEPTGNRLTRRSFTVALTFTSVRDPALKERKLIHCKARACTSLVEVSPRELHFGESDLNMLKGLPIFVRNRSDVTTYVELQFVSKVLSGPTGAVEVPPQQIVEVRLEIFPRKANPEYRKPITVVNLRNPSDRHTLEVKSQNVDRHRITFHSLFYRLITPMGANFLDFGSVVTNCRSVIQLPIENVSNGDLVLALSSSGPELSIWEVPKNVRPSMSSQNQPSIVPGQTIGRKGRDLPNAVEPQGSALVAEGGVTSRRERAESFLESVGDNRSRNIAKLAALPTVSREMLTKKKKSSSSVAWLDLARVSRPKKEHTSQPSPPVVKTAAEEKSVSFLASNIDARSNAPHGGFDSSISETGGKPGSGIIDPLIAATQGSHSRSIDNFLHQYETIVGGPLPVFATGSSEEQYVRSLIMLRRDFDQALVQGVLVPATEITIGARQIHRVVLMLNAVARPFDHSKTKQRKDFKLLVRMVDFQKDISANGFEPFIRGDHRPPVRELLVRASVTRSLIDLGQHHFNFGSMERGQKRQKTFVLFNRYEVPAIFAIRKSGSISSADLAIAPDGRYGIIRSFGRREIAFEFSPSLAGPFQEKLTVANVQDAEDSHEFLVKAFVKKPPNFALETEKLEFGLCALNEKAEPQTLRITNTSQKPRIFEIYSDARELTFESYTAEISFDEAVDPSIRGFSSLSTVYNLTAKQMEELETLQQKHKIAERKGQSDKAQLITAKMEQIRTGRKDDKFSDETGDKRDDEVISKQSSTQSKRTPNGITKEVEPRGVWTVHVVFRAIGNPANRNGRAIRRLSPAYNDTCQGTIYVREQRNADEERKVGFRATVKVPRQLHSLGQSHGGQQPVHLPLADQPTEEITRACVTVVAPFVDLKRLEVTQKKDAYFTLRNDCGFRLEWELLLHDIPTECIVTETSGELSPGETKRVDFTVIPSHVGPRKFALSIYNWPSSKITTVTFSYYAVLASYLTFPDFPMNELDFGICYVDPTHRFSKSRKLRVLNVSPEEIHVSVSSNLTQLQAFSDSSLEVQIQEIRLLGGEEKDVYVAFQPKTSAERESRGERNVIGGLRFSVVLAASQTDVDGEEVFVVGTQTLRFRATVGESRISLESNVIDFGRTTILGGNFTGAFTINNLSRLPTTWSCESETGRIALSSVWGELAPINEKNSLSSATVSITFEPTTYGFHRECLIIRNSNNVSQLLPIEVRLFVDPDILELTALGSSFRTQEPSHRESFSIYTLDFGHVYVLSVQDGQSVSFLLESRRSGLRLDRAGKRIELRSTSDQLIDLAPYSDLSLGVQLQQNHLETDVGGSSDDIDINISDILPTLRECGGTVTLQPRGKATVDITPPDPEHLNAEQVEALLGGQAVPVSGTIIFVDKQSVATVQTLKVQGLWGLSSSKLEPNFINLGLVRASRQAEVPFTFSVQNTASLPLLYELLTTDAVRILDSGASERGVVGSGSFANIVAFLMLSKLAPDASGPVEIVIRLRNERNAMDTPALRLFFTLAFLPLQLEHLVDNEVVLPRLMYPIAPPDSPPCDSWFTVRNMAEEETRFSFDVIYSPAVERALKIDVMWRSTNSPITGTVSISPRGSADILVRAIAVMGDVAEGMKDTSFGGQGSLTFGKVVLKVHYPDGELTQDITIRGSVIHGPKFGISPMNVVFLAHAEPSDDSEDDLPNLQDFPKKPGNHRGRRRRTNGSSIGSDQNVRVQISNFNPKMQLVFQVSVQNPPELRDRHCLRISPLDEDMKGVVGPGGIGEILIEWLGAALTGLSQPILVIVRECGVSTKAQETTIVVNVADPLVIRGEPDLGNDVELRSDQDSLLHAGDYLDDISAVSMTSLKGRPTSATDFAEESEFVVRSGMRRVESIQSQSEIDGFYELDAGQQDEGSTITRRIVLECVTPQRVLYKLRTVRDDDSRWFTFSRNEGTLEMLSQSILPHSHSITFTFNARSRGAYSTYLLIENTRNPRNLVVVRVSMEVVASSITAFPSSAANASRDMVSHAARADVFDVFVNGFSEESSEIVMRDLFYETEYATRSIVIRNMDSSTLEFTLTSDLPLNDPSELVFSLSRTSIKLFSSLFVAPSGMTRVYLRYLPSDETNHAQTFHQANISEEKRITVSVNCRSVRDHQKTVTIIAHVKKPQIMMTKRELLFRGRIVNGEPMITDLDGDILYVGNVLEDDLEYEVVDETAFFSIENLDVPQAIWSSSTVLRSLRACGATVPSSLFNRLRVRPDMDVVRRYAETLLRVSFSWRFKQGTMAEVLRFVAGKICL
ncbi:hypothetical protein M427DRAFT_176995 [Gonapodya prolifera JEL478]|uniref:Uncharacterized protein n=1 Tax=Gonapodya prolifera (strain JEL478) TaxID=1344416 RepID=A0A139APZ7_GONPJ|nr:hypothetical protein M427DRAFT_176995 [Gonapodya prolifera JEL478]|eukprot:KXS18827.1 hypothetical protein M427DRAFT_176995 [Gonapodya prolifera JEL478]